MAAPENEEICFVSYILIHMRYLRYFSVSDGSKIYQKIHFQTYFLLQITFLQKTVYESVLLKSSFMDAYYKGYCISFVTMASTLDFQDGQSWYVWLKMPPLTAIFATIFLILLGNICHSNDKPSMPTLYANIFMFFVSVQEFLCTYWKSKCFQKNEMILKAARYLLPILFWQNHFCMIARSDFISYSHILQVLIKL